MKLNFNIHFKDIAGVEIPGETFADAIAKALFLGRGVSLSDADEKYAAYRLSTKLLAANADIVLSDDELKLIRKVAAAALTPGAYGQLIDLLNPQLTDHAGEYLY
jgi:hypothetical protein